MLILYFYLESFIGIHKHKRRHFKKSRYEEIILALNIKKEEPQNQDKIEPKTIFDNTDRDHLVTEQNLEE